MGHNCFGSILGWEPGTSKMVEAFKPPPAKRFRSEIPCEEILAASCPTEIMMDPRIWKGFPEDLLEVMIARLPIAVFFRFRSVCQKWNSLLTSATLPQHFVEVMEARPPWIYALTNGDANNGSMYDPTFKKWFHRPIPLLPTKSVNFPVASAGGLICLFDARGYSLSVCNPLTCSFRQLPLGPSHGWAHTMVGMVQYRSFGQTGYKIVSLGSDGNHNVYDSIKNSWICPGNVPPDVKLPECLSFSSRTVSIRNTVYFMHWGPYGILSYDVVADKWKQMIFPLPPHVKGTMLADCRGRVLLVGLMSKNAAMSVGIWEFQMTTLTLKEVDRMPNIWCLEFYGKHPWMRCFGNQGLLVLSLNAVKVRRLVSYDMEKREWGKMPDCVLRRQSIATCGAAFYPCPTAVA